MGGFYYDLLPILAAEAIIVAVEDIVAMLGALGIQAIAKVRIESFMFGNLLSAGTQKLYLSLLAATIFIATSSISGLIL